MHLNRESVAHRQNGAGLIEVLVAVLLISMAALGLGSAQLSFKRVGFEAMQRTAAVVLAADLVERMRVNRSALSHYEAHALGTGDSSIGAATRDCSTQACTPLQLSHWDLQQWEASLKGEFTGESEGGLVEPAACIFVNAREVVVQISWQGHRDLAVQNDGVGCGSDILVTYGASRQYLEWATWVGER